MRGLTHASTVCGPMTPANGPVLAPLSEAARKSSAFPGPPPGTAVGG